MKPQVVITSYQRPRYLIPCLESFRQDDVELYVVDGGSDEETRRSIYERATGYYMMEGNPGADVLKNEGVRRFVTQPEFIISADDIVVPRGYSSLIFEQYRALNAGREKPEWTMMSCNMAYIEAGGWGDKFKTVNGVEVLEVGASNTVATIMDTAACKAVNYWPIYGKSGQGDHAISRRLIAAGYKIGYFRKPLVQHLGDNKWVDYPEYSKAFKLDEDFWYHEARKDDWRP